MRYALILAAALLVARPAEAGVSVRGRTWPVGATLRVGFLPDGLGRMPSPALRRRVLRIASQWSRHANVEFRESADRPQIRVAFRGGYWSKIGTEALAVPPGAATMSLGSTREFEPAWYWRASVLHEFGHALGLHHEHQSPACPLDIDADAVARCAGMPGEWAHFNTRRLDDRLVDFTEWDKHSIMEYPFYAEETLGGPEVPFPTTLSAGDRAYIARLYPRSPEEQRP